MYLTFTYIHKHMTELKVNINKLQISVVIQYIGHWSLMQRIQYLIPQLPGILKFASLVFMYGTVHSLSSSLDLGSNFWI